MPRSTDVDFLAIDEVQLAADPERGHVFTDRLLHVRGRQETLLLGAQTMRDAISDLIPGRQLHLPAAPFEAHLCRREEDHAAAAAHGAGRLLGVARSMPSPS